MCHPVAIAAGAIQAVGGTMQAMARHRQAKAAAARQNLIQQMDYQNKLAMAGHRDQMKANLYKRKLQAHAQATNAVYKQQQINQEEATRASIVNQQQRQETANELAFKGQEMLAAKIQAGGTVMASGMASGQSMLLALMDVERQLGQKEAQLNATMYDANIAYSIKEYGNKLDQYSADVSAINSGPASPVAESASFRPIKKPDVKGPSGLGLMGGIISSVGAGVGTGFSTYSAGAEHLGW